MTRYAAVLAVALLAGCSGAPVIRTVVVRQHVPRSLLTCAADPPTPSTGSAAAVGRYIVALWAAGQDCRNTLQSVGAALGSGSPAQ